MSIHRRYLPPPPGPAPAPEGPPESRGLAAVLPVAIVSLVVLGIAGIIGLAATLRPASSAPSPATQAYLDSKTPGRLGPLVSLEPTPPVALGVSITPITSLAAPSAGLAYSGESYEVACTISGSATLYPVVHNGTAWEGPYDSYGCTMTDAVANKATCIFPARQGNGLTWNVFKTGTGTVSSCTATGRNGPVPASRSSSGGGGGGTVTSIDCDAGLICTPDPITSSGTIAPDFGTAAGKVVQGGVVVGASCAYPTSFTFNNAGQVTACTAGSAPAVTGLANPTASVGLTAVNGVATTAMRSDAAPALDQGIAPTWTGAHTFNQTITLGAGAGLSGTAGAGALALSGLTGNWDLPTGSGTWAGANNKFVSFTATGAAGTMYFGADAPVTVSSANEIRLQSSGANRLFINSAVTLAANISLTGTAGSGGLSFGSMTGDFTLPTGTISYIGATNKTISLTTTGASGTITIKSTLGSTLIQAGTVRIQNAAGSDALWITGTASIAVYAGNFTTPASTVNFSWGSSTGNFTFPTGSLSWTGATDKTVSLLASGSSGTITIQTQGTGATLTIKTSGTSAFVLNDGTTGVVMRRNGSGIADFGNSNSTRVTMSAGISLAGAAGSGGLVLGSMTGNSAMPTGDLTWSGASGKNLQLYSSGVGQVDIQSGGAMFLLSSSFARLNGTSLELNATSTTATIDTQTGLLMSRVTTVIMDVGSTSSTAATLRAGMSLNANAGTGGMNWSGATGAFRFGASTATLGFFGATAVSQQNTTGTTTGFTSGSGAAVLVDSTFTGNTGTTAYTIGDIVRALKNYGLFAN